MLPHLMLVSVSPPIHLNPVLPRGCPHPSPHAATQVDILLHFVSYLRARLHDELAHAMLVWYDAVTRDGRLSHQNALTPHVKPFFDAAGAGGGGGRPPWSSSGPSVEESCAKTALRAMEGSPLLHAVLPRSQTHFLSTTGGIVRDRRTSQPSPANAPPTSTWA